MPGPAIAPGPGLFSCDRFCVNNPAARLFGAKNNFLIMTVFVLKPGRLLAALLLLPLTLHAQIEEKQVNESPYTAVYNHLYYLQSDSYQPELAARSFRVSPDSGVMLAIQLKQILDGKGLYIDLDRLPTRPQYRDSASGEAICYLNRSEPRIYLEQIDSMWYYSGNTVAAIPALHRKVFPLGAQIGLYFQAPIWQPEIFGIALWKWLGLTALLLLAVAVFRLAGWLSRQMLVPLLRRRLELTPEVQVSLKKLSRLLGLWLSLHFLRLLLPVLQIPARTNAWLMDSLCVLSAFLFIFMAIQVIHLLFLRLRKVAADSGSTLDDQFMPLLRRLAFVVVWAMGLLYILNYLEVNIAALLAGISIGGLAIALAAQDTVKNFFGSVMIFLDKPFQIGDAIQFGSVVGVVEEVGMRSTRIRTPANSLTYVPNAMLADEVVDNLGMRVYRRYKTDIGVTYDTPPALIDLFVKGIRAIIQQHPHTRKDFIEVHLNDFAPSSLNILLHTFFETSDYGVELRSRHQLMYAIMLLAERLGVQFAFPTQTLHIESFPGKNNFAPTRPNPAGAEKALEESLEAIGRYFNDLKN